eukprot:CAMPEP_0197699862 /NCGR_PEP_ID=MMETSP1338-20131121/121168_1 /TAXON_ID=43686 ORGANISM="Pelagodinium beii, Strain RCC1491" /NCGR_SAMPLE_ID=MMETSP1338 /ASSEMBLY_ACC=CAM_ASM_000754 /LENGTH=72 /DNA_ID=CAMNT_0043283403 /DNA_START=45 /DNA_END=259 /DNA_ORIENTATION=-
MEPVHERLFRTGTHKTRDQKKFEATLVPQHSTERSVSNVNKDAKISTVPGHGLKIVTYAPGKKEQKQDTATT